MVSDGETRYVSTVYILLCKSTVEDKICLSVIATSLITKLRVYCGRLPRPVLKPNQSHYAFLNILDLSVFLI